MDTETTGLDPRTDRITELAAVVLDAHASIIERATWHQQDGVDALRQRAMALEATFENGVFVSHNARFDVAFLASSPALAGTVLAAPERWMCTMRLCGRPTRLDVLAGALGVRCEDRHTAVGDADALVAILQRLIVLAEARGLDRVAGLAVACPVAAAGKVPTTYEETGWATIRAALDLVVPTRLATSAQREALGQVWAGLRDPRHGPLDITAVETAASELAKLSMSALVFDLCLSELMSGGPERSRPPRYLALPSRASRRCDH